VDCEFGLLHRAHGSVRFTQGKTSVLVAAYGPLPAPPRQEIIDRAVIEVLFKSPVGRSTVDLEYILAHLHPRCKISVIVQVEHDDGALLATCVNASTLALVDAGIQCRSLLAAVCLCAQKDRSGEPGGEERRQTLLDPTHLEEENSACVYTFGIVELPGTEVANEESKRRGELTMHCSIGDGCDVVLSETRGFVGTTDAYLDYLDLARKTAQAVQVFFRLSLQKKVEKNPCL